MKDVYDLEGATIESISVNPMSSITFKTSKGEVTIFGHRIFDGITIRETKDGVAFTDWELSERKISKYLLDIKNIEGLKISGDHNSMSVCFLLNPPVEFGKDQFSEICKSISDFKNCYYFLNTTTRKLIFTGQEKFTLYFIPYK